jgi:ABC-type oligopeptide transport system ATPase subunit
VEENNIILVEKLTKTYVMGAQTLHALREISFNIKKNEYTQP